MRLFQNISRSVVTKSCGARLGNICADAKHLVRVLLAGLVLTLFWCGAGIFFVLLLGLRVVVPRQYRLALLQRSIGRALRLLFYFLRFFRIIDGQLVFEGGVAPQGGAVLAANHPTLLDAFLVLAHIPHAACVVKSRLRRYPILRLLIDELGYVAHADSISIIDDCVKVVRQPGRPILFFPEGSRSPPGALGPLSRGAATVALRAGVPLIPLQLTCAPLFLAKGQRWHEIPRGCVDLKVRVCYPISAVTSVEACEKLVNLAPADGSAPLPGYGSPGSPGSTEVGRSSAGGGSSERELNERSLAQQATALLEEKFHEVIA